MRWGFLIVVMEMVEFQIRKYVFSSEYIEFLQLWRITALVLLLVAKYRGGSCTRSYNFIWILFFKIRSSFFFSIKIPKLLHKEFTHIAFQEISFEFLWFSKFCFEFSFDKNKSFIYIVKQIKYRILWPSTAVSRCIQKTLKWLCSRL